MAYKLLLADDSITIQKVVEITLSEEGFDVTAVGDGEAALEAAGKLVPDIVLADVFMPKMDGYQLCEKIKSDPRFSGVPVMLLAGTFEDFDESRASAVGSDDKLTKPFESAELVSKVRRLVEHRPSPAAAQAEVEAAFEAEPAEESNDLWSVVDMSSEEQPLAAATEVMSEEDLWKRANLVADEAEAEPLEEGTPIEDLPLEALEEAEELPEAFMDEDLSDAAEVEPYEAAVSEPADDSDRTAVLNMEDIQASVHAAQAEEPQAIEMSETSFEPEIVPFESLGEATEAEDFGSAPQPGVPPSPAAAPAVAAPAAVSEEMIRAEVLKAAQSIIGEKVKEALSAMTGEMIEHIVWDVVPELAEEIIRKEIENIKAGS